MLCLGIETSCDETSIALVEDGFNVFANEVASSAELHNQYGGIIPEIASRMHLESILPVFESALRKAGKTPHDIDAVCAVNRPGLVTALLVGFSFAKALSLYLEKPLVAVDHILAHLYAPFLTVPDNQPPMPFIGLIVSGGHTNLYIVRSWKDIELLGKTKDDAAGEALDKAAKMLGLGYPGGPVIDRLSKGVAPQKTFPVYSLKDNLDFSYSGLKTSLYYYLKKNGPISEADIPQVCADFQYAVVRPLIDRAFSACREFGASAIVFGGGVSANSLLREIARKKSEETGVKAFFPPIDLCLDNGAMIAGLGFHWLKGKGPSPISEDVYSFGTL